LRNVEAQLSQRWVVVEQHEAATDHGHGDHHMPPLRRLWRLLRPEMSDVWVVSVVALFIGILATAVPIAGQQLVRTVTFGTLYQPIVVLSLALFGFLVFMAGLQALNIFVAELIQRRLFARLVADLSYRLPRVRFTATEHHYPPELINRFFDVITVQKVVAGLLVDGIALVLTTIVGMALLAFYHPFLLGYDLILLALMVFVIAVIGRGGSRTAIQESIAKYKTAAWLEDVGRCLLSFKMYGAADFSVDRADRLTAEYLTARQRHFRVLLRQFLCIFGVQALASTVLLGLGGYLVMREQLTLGQLVAAELVVTNIVGSFAKLTKHIEGFYDLMASVDKLGHLIDLPMEPQRGLMTMASGTAVELEVRNLGVAAPHIHLEEHDAPEDAQLPHELLHDLSFSAPSRGTVAIVGPPGSGKSLLLDTLFELREPAAGAVLIDGIDPTDLRRDVLRRHVAMVRDIEMIEGTIADNVHFSRPDVDTNRVRDALTLVGLMEELRHLPRGIETPISSTGRPLSESQARRLMLARALAGRPRLLLIDGLLDGLADELLTEVWERLQQSAYRPTIVIATGRQALSELCDQVVSLDHAAHGMHGDDGHGSRPPKQPGGSHDHPDPHPDFRSRGGTT
jgi:putative ABC transport system ATP-binding protein